MTDSHVDMARAGNCQKIREKSDLVKMWCGGRRQRSVSGHLCMDGDLFVIGRSKTTNHRQSRGCKSSGRSVSTDLSLKRWFRGSQSKSTNAPWDSCYLLANSMDQHWTRNNRRERVT
ncbi:uncharacterized protein LOC114876564 isoform X2 [Osmia bicornis bicornis]|nr:uncharacterized protein LOC114876564 isoform X2 [Osmia bicornis bicornis]